MITLLYWASFNNTEMYGVLPLARMRYLKRFGQFVWKIEPDILFDCGVEL